MDITFTNVFEIPEIYYPKPSSKHVPEWYVTSLSYTNNQKKPLGNGQTSATIKKCMPVFDSIVSGYILETYVDVYVSQQKTPSINSEGVEVLLNQPTYEWPSYEPIQFHSKEQAPTHPNNNGHVSYPKWTNPWSIKTPRGYSILIVQPFHRESLFTIFPGVVDTDTYSAPINFPFVLNDVTFEGLIPAGTPMAQIIPFKRTDWKMSIGSEKDKKYQDAISLKLRTRFFDSYKTFFRQVKEYK